MISMRSASLRAPAGSAGWTRAGPSTHAWTYIYGFQNQPSRSTSTRAKTEQIFGGPRACVRECAPLQRTVEGLMEEQKEVEALISEGLKWERRSAD